MGGDGENNNSCGIPKVFSAHTKDNITCWFKASLVLRQKRTCEGQNHHFTHGVTKALTALSGRQPRDSGAGWGRHTQRGRSPAAGAMPREGPGPRRELCKAGTGRGREVRQARASRMAVAGQGTRTRSQRTRRCSARHRRPRSGEPWPPGWPAASSADSSGCETGTTPVGERRRTCSVSVQSSGLPAVPASLMINYI